MNEQLHPIFADILNRQFAEVFPQQALPLADCDKCKHRTPDMPYAHCYMFANKPGPRCGQFQPERIKQLQSQLHIKGEQV